MLSYKEEWKGGYEEVEKKVWQQHNCHQFTKRVKIVAVSHQSTFECDLICGVNVRRDFLALSSELSQFEFLVCIRCIVKPFPGEGKESYHKVLQENRDLQITQKFEVCLNQIRIVDFRKIVVVTGAIWFVQENEISEVSKALTWE